MVLNETNNKWTTIETRSGVKQGGPFSPVAFDEYIDEMIKIIIRSDKVIKIEGIVTGIVIYADDTTLACNTYEDLQQVIPIFLNYCEKFDILVNI